MSFSLPSFPSICALYTNVGNDFATKVYRSSEICQLRGPQQGPRLGPPAAPAVFNLGSVPLLLLQPGVDIRDYSTAQPPLPDFVEIPQGTGRWYVAVFVDDVALGFPNVHRYAIVGKLVAGGVFINVPPWPTPIP